MNVDESTGRHNYTTNAFPHHFEEFTLKSCELKDSKQTIPRSGPNTFTDTGYNFEYRFGFPTPWYSRYYDIPRQELSAYGPENIYQGNCSFIDLKCLRTPTPSNEYLIYGNVSLTVLTGQAILALIPTAITVASWRLTDRLKNRNRI